MQAAACDPEFIYREKVSSVANRPKLDEVLKHLRKGDTLVVTKLDRLARSMRDLLRIVDLIQGKKAALRILGTDIDTGTSTGKLMLNLLGSFAEFERQIILRVDDQFNFCGLLDVGILAGFAPFIASGSFWAIQRKTAFRSWARPRDRRDITVPIGSPTTSAISA